MTAVRYLILQTPYGYLIKKVSISRVHRTVLGCIVSFSQGLG